MDAETTENTGQELANDDHQDAAVPGDRFLHIADLHFWEVVLNPLKLLNKRFLGNLNVALRRRHEFPMERAEGYIDALKQTGITTILLTGDFTSTATDGEFERARQFVDALVAAGLAVHVLPGNHDVYTFGAGRGRRFERYFRDYLPENGYPVQARLPHGTPLVFVPTVCPNLLSSRGYVTKESVDVVAQHLAEYAADDETKAPHLVVGGHYPVLTETYGYSAVWGRRLANGDLLRRAMGGSGVQVLYVSGHTHRFSYVEDPKYPNLHHLSTGAFFRINRKEAIEGEFAEVRVGASGFEVFRHTCRDGWKRHRIPPGGE
jgi:3',5'-cyclic AMP phosphodiesterase CpdA